MAAGEQKTGKWHIQMLGEFVVQQPDGTPVPVSNKRPDALLAALAYYEGGQPGSRRFHEQFAEEIAREQRKKPLTNSQRVSLVLHDDILHTNWVSVQYNLLETLVSEALLQGRGNYGLKNALFLSDVDTFEQEIRAAKLAASQPDEQCRHLLKAVSLYKGPFLARFPLDVEPWIEKPRLFLQDAYMQALHVLAEHVRKLDANLASYCEAYAAKAQPIDEHAVTRLERLLPASSPSSVVTIEAAEATINRAEIESSKTQPSPVLSPSALPNNLPQQVTSFIGREQEKTEITALLGTARLLTLTGSGGCGKTRLALQVAAEALENYADGVWVVELAPLADPNLVVQEAATAFGAREEAGRPLAQTLVDFLKSKRLLLVLDNCEHVLDACAQLAASLLKNCPAVQILTSSLQPLGIAGEQSYRVPSLSVPDVPHRQTVESVRKYEAARLFLERASAVDARFQITDASAPALAQLCTRLDGIPLAIELAAARVRSYSVEEINNKLDNCFRLLMGGSRTAIPRHQTLRALIDWSYDLLDAQEKSLLRRLSVFAGGWTLEAAEHVCAGPDIQEWEVLTLLPSLVDKSLVVAEHEQEQTRYHLLEIIRQYARERLEEYGEGESAQYRHQAFFLAFAEAVRPRLSGPDETQWLHRLEQDHDNIRAALDLYLRQNAAREALRLVSALERFWHLRGHLSEGRWRLQQALALPGADQRTVERAAALLAAGWLALKQDDYAEALVCLEECLRIYEENQERQGMARALRIMGLTHMAQGRYDEARDQMEQSLTLYKNTGNKDGEASVLNNLGILAQYEGNLALSFQHFHSAFKAEERMENTLGVAIALHNLGEIAYLQQEYAQAQTYYERSLEQETRLKNKSGSADSLLGLGCVALRTGRFTEAAAKLREALLLFREVGDNWGISDVIAAFAELALVEKETERSARLLGAVHTLRERLGAPLPYLEQQEHERHSQAGQQILGREAFQALYAEAKEWTQEQMIAEALSGGRRAALRPLA